ncbi:hemin uptake protein HemP [Prosthecomicrobium hirschii]|nr:hemin uptake protein HemP [Prosthecomicrobium hirschii]MCW1842566.1 hemin uptake protein HemP [Prosthecomicrobium hirschii]TPQ52818.1 hemin uptake protein HemP [Prosthecomicrobium hirschii]
MARPEADRGLPTFDSRELVGIGREAVILHEGQAYRLRITSNRKLILTK